MKKLFTIILILNEMLNVASAQTQNWLWFKGSGGSGYQYGSGIGTDDSGYFYIGGRFGGTITFDTKSESAGGLNHLFGKFDQNGNCLWLSQAAYGFDYPRGFCTDRAKNNNEYQAGNTNSGGGMFIDKVNNAGVLQWSTLIGQNGGGNYGAAPNADGIAADTAGNVYVTGETGDGSGTNWTYGDSILNYPGTGGSQEMFLTKMDKNGHFLWAIGADGIDAAHVGYDVGRGIILSKSGPYVFVCGGYTGTPSFHSRFPGGDITAPPAAIGTSSLFIAKYDTAGNLLFVTTATNAGIPYTSPFNSGVGYINAIAVDSCDNIFVTGYYEGTAQFGPLSITASNTGSNSDGFVASCNSKGQWQWVDDIGSSASVTDVGSCITLDKNSDVYVAGSITGTANLGNGISLTATSPQGSLFIAKYANSTGAVLWAQTSTGTGNNGPGGIAVDDQQFVYMSGTFYGTMGLPGTTTLTATGGLANIFIAKLDTVSPRYIVPVVDSSYCPGSNTGISYSIVGTFNPGNTFTAQLSDSTGSFVNAVNIGDTASTNSGSIKVIIPANTPPGSDYLIRVVSSNPATSSYVNGCGTYHRKNVYLNNFYITIGNSSVNLQVSGDTTVCAGSLVQLNVSGAAAYTWSPANSLTDSTSANPVASPVVSTTYTITGANGGCKGVKQVAITVGAGVTPGSISTDRDTICQNTPGNLSLSGNSGSKIQWQSSPDDASFTDALNDTLVNYKTNPLQQSTWYRAIVGSGSCSAISDSLQLIVPPALTANFDYTQSTLTQLNFNSDSSRGSIRSYHWDFGDGSTSEEKNPSHTYAKDSTYYVCLTLYDGSNCSYTFCRYSLVTGIPTVAAMGNWVAYPNPFTNELTISAKNTGSHIQSVEMYNVLGQLVINKSVGNSSNNSLQLDVSQLAKGMYYIMIRTADADFVQKVVKQ